MDLGLIAVVFEYGYFGTTNALVQQPHKFDETFTRRKCFNLTYVDVDDLDKCNNALNLFCSEYV